MHTPDIGFFLVAIITLGIASQWVAWRYRIPAIVLLAAAGLLVGPGLELIRPAELFGDALSPIVGLCVAIILFEGGLSLDFRELKVAASGVRRLVYVGAPLGWGLGALAAHFVGGLSWPVALVFGAIMVVTGPTVVMPMLRQAGLGRRSASYLKWEGIVNDPIGALLAVLVFNFFVYASPATEVSGWGSVVSSLTKALLAGGVLGGMGGWLVGKAFQRGLVPEYLKSPVMFVAVLVFFTLSNLLQHEAGLLAVTVMGMVVGNMHLPGIEDMRRFKEYITVMLVSLVFVLLTADLDRQVLLELDWRGMALIVAILFITRPLAIMLATTNAGMNMNDRILLAWIAPRGIVAAATAGIMGPGLAAGGYEDATALLPLVFGIIFSSVVLHGLSIGWLARKLGLVSREAGTVLLVGASPWSVELAQKMMGMGIRVVLADSSWHNLRAARLAGVLVYYGEILSEIAEESVEIAHVETVLAATSNDAYNALVCTAMAPEIGRSAVFQLPMGDSMQDDPKAVARPLRGNIAFGQDALFERLWRAHVRGWKFSRTTITDTYSYSDFLGDCPAKAISILVQRANGKVVFQSTQLEYEPQPGDTVLYYAPEKPAEVAPAAASTPA